MVDISHKDNTVRVAIAQAIVTVGSPETIAAVEQGNVPKGNVFEMSKAAGFLAVKKTDFPRASEISDLCPSFFQFANE